jgi:hypothetical protein
VTKQEIESLQCIVDQIGAGLDALMDFVCDIETKAKKPKTPAKKSAKKTPRK